jgi:hypothetical protein
MRLSLVVSNRIVDSDILEEIWEELKIEIAESLRIC